MENLNQKIRGKTSLSFFLSKNAGAVVIVMGLIFGIWSSIGDVWYKYLLNPILIFIAGMFLGTPFIEGLTRGFSYLYLFKSKGLSRALIMIIPTIIFFVIAFLILNFVFKTSAQLILFLVIYIILSIIVAINDGRFLVAIDKTRAIEDMPNINPRETQ